MFARALQLVGFLIVSYVLVDSLVLREEPDMTAEFGGLILGGALFLVGRMLSGDGEGAAS